MGIVVIVDIVIVVRLVIIGASIIAITNLITITITINTKLSPLLLPILQLIHRRYMIERQLILPTFFLHFTASPSLLMYFIFYLISGMCVLLLVLVLVMRLRLGYCYLCATELLLHVFI